MRKVFECAIVVAIIGIVASMFTPITFLNRGTYRAEIRGLYDRVERGMTRAQVQDAMASGHYPNLRFSRDDAPTWYASAPLEFGAGNWVLLISFEGERVSGLRVRTADSHEFRPAEAPPDK